MIWEGSLFIDMTLQYDTAAMNTIDQGVVRRIRVLWVWCHMPIVIKVDTASMGPRLGDDEARRGGHYNVDGIAAYCPS